MDVRAESLRWWLGAALVLAGACGGSAAENRSCPLLAESCWNTAVAEAQACAPATPGILASDNRTCLFDDGRLAVFDQSLTFPVRNTDNLAFTLVNDTQCARYVEDFANFTLTTASGPHKVVSTPSGVSLTCGDGTTTSTKWSDCSDNGTLETVVPEVSFLSSSEGYITLSFQGYFMHGLDYSTTASWFRCEKP